MDVLNPVIFYRAVIQLLSNTPAALKTIHAGGDTVYTDFWNKRLIFSRDPSFMEQVFLLEAKGQFNRDFLYKAKYPVFGDGLVNSKKERWSQQRRLMQPLFNRESVSRWQAIIFEESESLVANLMQQGNATVNLSIAFKGLVQAFFLRILLGRGLTEEAQAESFLVAVEAISKGLLPLLSLELLGKGNWRFLWYSRRKRLQIATQQIKAVVDQALDAGHDENSLLGLMATAIDSKSGCGMSTALLRDEIVNLFFAGQDTTLNTLQWFFYLVASHEDIQGQIIAEVLQFGADALKTGDFEKLEFTRATLYETLRLYPSTAAIATQAVAENIQIWGNTVPKGATILLSLFANHRHPNHWQYPETFHPGHFLGESSVQRHHYAYLPFGAGMHNCIGKHLAEFELMVVIVSLMRAFRFTTTLQQVPIANSITLKPKRHIIVSVKPH